MRLYNTNTGANIFAGIELGGAGPSNDGLVGINGVVTAAGSGALTFYTRDSNTFAEKMRITSGGNVGIGTSTPTGAYGKLSVAGGIKILDDNNGKLEIGRYSSGAPNSYIKIGTNSNSLRIANATDTVDLFYFQNLGASFWLPLQMLLFFWVMSCFSRVVYPL
jgi:hypothetical protein